MVTIVSGDIFYSPRMLGEWMLIVLSTKMITKVMHGNQLGVKIT
jgi:hypothetical protein